MTSDDLQTLLRTWESYFEPLQCPLTVTLLKSCGYQIDARDPDFSKKLPF